MPVLTLGQKINFKNFEIFAKKRNLKLIFDAAACHDPNIIKEKLDLTQFSVFHLMVIKRLLLVLEEY